MKFDIYSDPGHAWCKVPRKLLHTLGISDKISRFSYMRGNHVYLEEDGDLRTFVEALKASGRTFEYREHHTDHTSKIRNYWTYDPSFHWCP